MPNGKWHILSITQTQPRVSWLGRKIIPWTVKDPESRLQMNLGHAVIQVKSRPHGPLKLYQT